MKYLVLAVYYDGSQVMTHYEEMDLGFTDPESCAEEILDKIDTTDLRELLVFKSAQNYGSAPEKVAHWNHNELFGSEDDDEDQEDDWSGPESQDEDE